MNNIERAIDYYTEPGIGEHRQDKGALIVAALREVKAWRSGKWEYESIDINGPLDVKLAELFKEQE
jgi:hypothetical protein